MFRTRTIKQNGPSFSLPRCSFLDPDSRWSSNEEKHLLGPYDYLAARPGKDIRTRIIDAFNLWLKVPAASLEIIKLVIKLLHNASLLIDDIEDGSVLRRGLPSTHEVFGIPQTLNCANYVYFIAQKELSKLRNPTEALGVFVDGLLTLHRGQGLDIFWRDTSTVPTMTQYLDMAAQKTGGLLSLAVRLMQVESEVNIDCTTVATILGVLFQIRDDYMNLKSDLYTANKGLCDDLTEGKFSFPIIHSIHADPTNHQLINILKKRSNQTDIKLYAVKYMEETGSFEYSRKVLEKIQSDARGMIGDLEGNAALVALLEDMAIPQPGVEVDEVECLLPPTPSSSDHDHEPYFVASA